MTAVPLERLAVTTRYTPHRPHPPQHAFLLLDELCQGWTSEALYGGAAGGGKSDALLMAALRYVHVPGYAALLLRKTFTDLELADALIPRSLEWLSGTDADYNAARYRWTFPSGAILQFGYLRTEAHRYRYQGSAWQFVGFDELTQFPLADYTYLFSRLRRPTKVAELAGGDGEDLDELEARRRIEALSRVPLRMRAASNPGGIGHEWVKRRFLEKRVDDDDPEDTPARARRRIFIPAKLEDNPSLDADAYRSSLSNLDRTTRGQLLDGDWNLETGDRIYRRAGIDAAINLGAELEYLADRGEAPAPDGGLLELGLDWGEHTWHVTVWPLPGGGVWVVDAAPHLAQEPGSSTEAILASLGELPVWEGAPRVRDPLELVESNYDAAGIQSMRTFRKIARRRVARHKAHSIPFGSYKRETIGYLKHLFERAEEGHTRRIIAVSPHLSEFITQLRNLRKDPADPELPLKPKSGKKAGENVTPEEERDDGPDALIAATARIARKHRARGK